MAAEKASVWKWEEDMMKEEFELQKAGWLVASVRQLSEDSSLLQMFPPFITLKNLRGILQVAFWFPCFVRVSLPYYQILIVPASFPVIFDQIYFVFFFSIDKIRWWFRKIPSVNIGFTIWSKAAAMNDIVYLPLNWELESVCHRSQYFYDLE